MSDRFDTFTDGAKQVLVGAQRAAQRLDHPSIGTEHLLLGLVDVEAGHALAVLRELGVEAEQVRRAVEAVLTRGDRMVIGDISLTPRAKKAIELTVAEARRLRQDHIATEHLLLGLVAEGEGIATGVLTSLRVEREPARAAVRRLRDAPGA